MYKLQELESMLKQSMLMDELDLLDRSVFHRTSCQLDKCELEIFSERQGNSVWIHRKTEICNLIYFKQFSVNDNLEKIFSLEYESFF